MDLHRLGEERSIAMDRAVAEKLRANPRVLEAARARVGSLPIDELVAALVDSSEDAGALRQASPFAGALDARTRWCISKSVT